MTSSVLLYSLPLYGHVSLSLGIATILSQQGHNVNWLMGADPFVNDDWHRKVIIQSHINTVIDNSLFEAGIGPRLMEKIGQRSVYNNLGSILNLIAWGNRIPIEMLCNHAMVASLLRHIDRIKPSVILTEWPTALSIAAELAGVPYKVNIYFVAIASRYNKILNQIIRIGTWKIDYHINQIRKGFGLQPVQDPLLASFTPSSGSIWGSIPELYGLREPPKGVHSVGLISSDGGIDLEKRTSVDLNSMKRPIIYATVGTFIEHPSFFTTLSEASHLINGSFIASTGWRNLSVSPIVSDNVKLVPFISNSAILPKVDAGIFHGGFNTMQQLAANGVPSVVIPSFSPPDELVNALAWQRAGLGPVIHPRNFNSKALAEALEIILDRDSFHRLAAKKIKAKFKSRGGIMQAVEILLSELS